MVIDSQDSFILGSGGSKPPPYDSKSIVRCVTNRAVPRGVTNTHQVGHALSAATRRKLQFIALLSESDKHYILLFHKWKVENEKFTSGVVISPHLRYDRVIFLCTQHEGEPYELAGNYH